MEVPIIDDGEPQQSKSFAIDPIAIPFQRCFNNHVTTVHTDAAIPTVILKSYESASLSHSGHPDSYQTLSTIQTKDVSEIGGVSSSTNSTFISSEDLNNYSITKNEESNIVEKFEKYHNDYSLESQPYIELNQSKQYIDDEPLTEKDDIINPSISSRFLRSNRQRFTFGYSEDFINNFNVEATESLYKTSKVRTRGGSDTKKRKRDSNEQFELFEVTPRKKRPQKKNKHENGTRRSKSRRKEKLDSQLLHRCTNRRIESSFGLKRSQVELPSELKQICFLFKVINFQRDECQRHHYELNDSLLMHYSSSRELMQQSTLQESHEPNGRQSESLSSSFRRNHGVKTTIMKLREMGEKGTLGPRLKEALKDPNFLRSIDFRIDRSIDLYREKLNLNPIWNLDERTPDNKTSRIVIRIEPISEFIHLTYRNSSLRGKKIKTKELENFWNPPLDSILSTAKRFGFYETTEDIYQIDIQKHAVLLTRLKTELMEKEEDGTRCNSISWDLLSLGKALDSALQSVNVAGDIRTEFLPKTLHGNDSINIQDGLTTQWFKGCNVTHVIEEIGNSDRSMNGNMITKKKCSIDYSESPNEQLFDHSESPNEQLFDHSECPNGQLFDHGGCPKEQLFDHGGCPNGQLFDHGGSPNGQLFDRGGCPNGQLFDHGGCPKEQLLDHGVCPKEQLLDNGGCPKEQLFDRRQLLQQLNAEDICGMLESSEIEELLLAMERSDPYSLICAQGNGERKPKEEKYRILANALSLRRNSYQIQFDVQFYEENENDSKRNCKDDESSTTQTSGLLTLALWIDPDKLRFLRSTGNVNTRIVSQRNLLTKTLQNFGTDISSPLKKATDSPQSHMTIDSVSSILSTQLGQEGLEREGLGQEGLGQEGLGQEGMSSPPTDQQYRRKRSWFAKDQFYNEDFDSNDDFEILSKRLREPSKKRSNNKKQRNEENDESRSETELIDEESNINADVIMSSSTLANNRRAGRPKVNRSGCKCLICKTCQTPQWRFMVLFNNDDWMDLVCNACYMKFNGTRPHNSKPGKILPPLVELDKLEIPIRPSLQEYKVKGAYAYPNLMRRNDSKQFAIIGKNSASGTHSPEAIRRLQRRAVPSSVVEDHETKKINNVRKSEDNTKDNERHRMQPRKREEILKDNSSRSPHRISVTRSVWDHQHTYHENRRINGLTFIEPSINQFRNQFTNLHSYFNNRHLNNQQWIACNSTGILSCPNPPCNSTEILSCPNPPFLPTTNIFEYALGSMSHLSPTSMLPYNPSSFQQSFIPTFQPFLYPDNAMSNVPISTSMSNVPIPTSMSNVPISPSMSNVPISTSMSNVPISTSMSNVPISTSMSNVPISTFSSTLPNIVSSSPIQSATISQTASSPYSTIYRRDTFPTSIVMGFEQQTISAVQIGAPVDAAPQIPPST